MCSDMGNTQMLNKINSQVSRAKTARTLIGRFDSPRNIKTKDAIRPFSDPLLHDRYADTCIS